MAAKKFTFKKYPREGGLRSIGYPYQDVYIKLDGCEVGRIGAPCYATTDQKWSVCFAIMQTPTKEDPCPFYWDFHKQRFDNEAAARAYVQQHFDKIVVMGLYKFEKD